MIVMGRGNKKRLAAQRLAEQKAMAQRQQEAAAKKRLEQQLLQAEAELDFSEALKGFVFVFCFFFFFIIFFFNF